ncbi:hypothetical protein ACFFQF_30230 [Haladaptatus pallidirubidus]|uniref:TraC-like domain-containing protein n=1 Tax=Haladaptatus pallidirubidus TaxID=1008152 RepID=A0AAV3UI40_9EURY|nr:hypothetical protein [Haladaptatus pallidirubidus]
MDSPPPATDTSTASSGLSGTQDKAETETAESDSTTPTSAPDKSPTQPSADCPTVRTALGIPDQAFETDAERPESDLDILRTMDAALAEIDTDLPTAREEARARDQFQLEDKLNKKTTAQAQLGFDYVRDDGITVDDEDYIGLVKVQPRNWLTLNHEQRRQVMSDYISFLMALDWAIAIPCYPREFDLGEHYNKFIRGGTSVAARGQSPILQYGRRYYIQWAQDNIDGSGIKTRDYYIVIRVNATQVTTNLDTGSVLNQLSTLPLIGSAGATIFKRLPWVKHHEKAEAELCIREVHNRQRRVIDKLGRTDVMTELVSTRQETMEILYHYYNHVKPEFDKFDHATFSEGMI